MTTKILKESNINNRARTFTGCWACRLKKRRCDIMKPKCSLCTKNNTVCSYDIRLIWSDDNNYKPSENNQMINYTEYKNLSTIFSCSKNKITKKKGTRLTKQEFKDMTKINDDSNMNTNKKNDAKNIDENKFTISVRRFQVYDNAVKSVFGSKRNRIYDQKIIDNRLDSLLFELENQLTNSDSGEHYRGPFRCFTVDNRKDGQESDYDTSNIESPLFSPISPTSFSPTSCAHYDESSIVNTKIKQESTSFEFTSLSTVEPSMLYLNPIVVNEESIEESVYNTLLIHTTDNMILNRFEYSEWFVKHVKVCLQYDECHIIENIMKASISLDIEKWFVILLGNIINVDLQTIGVTILVVLMASINSDDFIIKLEDWFLTQNIINYSMYPLINFIIRNTNSCKMLYHCHRLLNNNITLEDTYQDELTFELNVMITEKLVGKWEDKILQELYEEKDTSQSCSQLKYWELQFNFNQQFYRDVYLIDDCSNLQTV